MLIKKHSSILVRISSVSKSNALFLFINFLFLGSYKGW